MFSVSASFFRTKVLLLLVLAVFLSSQTGCRLRNPFRPLTENVVRSGDLSREGNAALTQENYAEAEHKFREAMELNNNDPELRLHLAEALWQQEKRDESLTLLFEAAQTAELFDPAQRMTLETSLAEKMIALERCEQAAAWAERGIRTAPKNGHCRLLRARARVGLADQLAGAGEADPALLRQGRDDYFRALALAPQEERTILPELARLQMRLGEAEHALATWQNLQGLYPNGSEPSDVLVGKAETFLMLRRAEDAADCLATASVREPDNLDLCLRRAAVEIDTGRYSQADATLRHAYHLAPSHPAWARLHQKLRFAVSQQAVNR